MRSRNPPNNYPPPSSNEIPFGIPSFCRKAYCSECQTPKPESEGRWTKYNKTQWRFICEDCKR